MTELVLTRRVRRVQSWARGAHWPTAYMADDGHWRCHDCGRRLRPYTTNYGERRLRHYWRDRP